jgi:hypothetical protein
MVKNDKVILKAGHLVKCRGQYMPEIIARPFALVEPLDVLVNVFDDGSVSVRCAAYCGGGKCKAYQGQGGFKCIYMDEKKD